MNPEQNQAGQVLSGLVDVRQKLIVAAIRVARFIGLLGLAFGGSLLIHLVLSLAFHFAWNRLIVPNLGLPEVGFWLVFLTMFGLSLIAEVIQRVLRPRQL